jgi:hypothetical protein
MTGAALGGLLVALAGPGWAMTLCGLGMTGTVPLMLALRPTAIPGALTSGAEALASAAGVVSDRAEAIAGRAADTSTSMLRELRDGWTEFRSHTWLWVIVLQFCLVMMAWYAGFQVLGPVVARQHLGGAAAWGAITAADALGLIAGGVVSLRFAPRKPMRFVVLTGGVFALAPLSLALVVPLAAVAAVSFGIGILGEVMMVQWTVALARAIPPDKLARVSSYDALGSMMAMPLGALAAGPLAAVAGVPATEFGAAALIVVVSALCLLPRDIRTIDAGQLTAPVPPAENAPEPVPAR